MSVDVVNEMTRLWSDLREELDSLDADSSDQVLEKLLDHVAVLRGVEAQVVYPELEERDDEGDVATSQGNARWEKVQNAMEKLTLPPSESAWKAFANALGDHLDQSPYDVGARLEGLSAEDRSELGVQAKSARETLS